MRRLSPAARFLGTAVLPLALLADRGTPAAAEKEEKASAPDLAARLAALEDLPLEAVWPAVNELKERLAAADSAPDTDPARALAARLSELGEKARLGGAAILLSRRDQGLYSRGQVALLELAREGADPSVRIAAMRLLGRSEFTEPVFLGLNDVLKGTADADMRIEACLALWELEADPKLRSPLLELLAEEDPRTRAAAALALAETGYFRPPVDRILWEMRREPTARGKLAGHLYHRLATRPQPESEGALWNPEERLAELSSRVRELERDNDRLERRLEEKVSGNEGWHGVIQEVLQHIRSYSLRGRQVATRDLYVAALSGMVSFLDEYSAFLDPQEVQRLEARELGAYWGIGVQLVKPGQDDPLVVSRVYRGGPAHRAGMRAGDQILEVSGVTTHDHELEELKDLVAGEGSGPALLRVRSWGQEAPRLLQLERGAVESPALEARLLPAGIGYVRLFRFVPGAAAEVRAAIERLGASDLRALVLDLRDNPGGRLDEGVRLADLFVGEESGAILTLRGADGKPSKRFSSAGTKLASPLVILVNRLSASASEVVAGILKDLGRARIVGERSFGKGVEQVTVTLSDESSALIGGKSQLLLTHRLLYLPRGRPIQPETQGGGRPGGGEPGGIEPDVAVEPGTERFQGRELGELERVMCSREVNDYIRERFDEVKALARGEAWSPAPYPGLDDLVASLDTTLSAEDVRYAVHDLLRRHLGDEDRAPGDYQADRQLQRAILEALRALGVAPASVPEYAGFAELHFPRAPAEEP
jgi:carboxyl-terminal processing protease